MIRLRRLVFNQRGMSLIEMAICLVIVGLVASASASLLIFSTNVKRSAFARSEFHQVVTLAQLSSATLAGCTANFRALRLSGADINNEISMYFYDRAGARMELITQAGQTHSQLFRMESVRLVPSTQISAVRYLANVEFVAEKLGPAVGSSRMTRSFPVIATVNDRGEVISCRGQTDPGGVQEIQQKICEIASGAEMYFDVSSGTCIPRYQVRCYSGDADTATCGTGSVSINVIQSCLMLNVTDPNPTVITRVYAGGRTATRDAPGPYMCENDDPTLTTTCVPADDAIFGPGAPICKVCCNVDMSQEPGW